MLSEVINDPKNYFYELGGLHDACVGYFSWDMKKKTLCISIDDLNCNFLDLPEYRGLRPVDIMFIGVIKVDINVQISDDAFRIYDMDFINENGIYEVKIGCSPGGYIKCKCGTIELRDA